MKFGKSATIIAALAMATTGALVMSQKDAEATSVATVTTSTPARLYTDSGLLIRNRALAPNTPWLVGKIVNFHDETMYQVATNEYLKASDSSLKDSNANKKLIGTVVGIISPFIYNDQINDINGKMLPAGTSWAIGKHIINKYNQPYVQISSHEYVETTYLKFNGELPTPIYIGNFATLDKNPDDDTTNNTLKDYVPNLQNINNYFIKYLNALHAANGLAPVQGTTDMINYAQQRAEQQIPAQLDHSTATRDTSENLSTAGLSYLIETEGIQSDKDVAYFILKDFYDDDKNRTPIGQPGHFGHRAALLYSGPNVGLGMTEYHAAFDADWNYGTMDQFNQLYNYTGSNPNTKFISKNAI